MLPCFRLFLTLNCVAQVSARFHSVLRCPACLTAVLVFVLPVPCCRSQTAAAVNPRPGPLMQTAKLRVCLIPSVSIRLHECPDRGLEDGLAARVHEAGQSSWSEVSRSGQPRKINIAAKCGPTAPQGRLQTAKNLASIDSHNRLKTKKLAILGICRVESQPSRRPNEWET